MPIAVLLIEDHALLSTALQVAFEQDGRTTVVGAVASVEDGVQAAAALQPDVILTDRRLPDGDMDAHAARLVAASPSSRIVLMSGWPTQRSSLAALDAGVHAIVSKSQPLDQIIEAVMRVTAGELVIPAHLARSLVGRRDPRAARDRRAGRSHAELTRRELDILESLACGESTVDTAARLDISHNTVRNHLAGTMLKLGVHDRLSAVAEGIRLGLVAPRLPDAAESTETVTP